MFALVFTLRSAVTNEWLYLFALTREETHKVKQQPEHQRTHSVHEKAFYQIIFLYESVLLSLLVHALRTCRTLTLNLRPCWCGAFRARYLASILRFSLFVSVCIVQKNFRSASPEMTVFVVPAVAAIALRRAVTFVITFLRNES